LVVLEPRTGQLLAHVGGRDYATSPYDRATSARRQPGSVFKPVVVLTALARGREDGAAPDFTLASVLLDRPLSIRMPIANWSPANHDRRFRGPVTLREALERSLNVPMVRLGQALGLTRVIATARRLGIESRLEANPTLPLGTFEVTLLEMTRAYGVFAAGGLRPPLRSVLAVRTRENEPVALAETPTLRVFAPEETYLLTTALQGAVDRGTSRNLRDLGYRGAVAGKTGTTSGFRDAWFVAYTPEIVVGTWMGFDFDRPLGLSGSEGALPVVADVLTQVIGRQGGRHFRAPPGLLRRTVEVQTGDRCQRRVEWFLPGTVPEGGCAEADPDPPLAAPP
jgi:penicillin-binding protein 1B